MPAAISRERLLEEAVAQASEHGVASLTVRGLAKRCGVSVGTVYRHFATKSELSVAAMRCFFRQRLFEDFCEPNDGRDFLAYCTLFVQRMESVMDEYARTWLKGVEGLPQDERLAAKQRESEVMEHIVAGLTLVFEHDRSIVRERLPEGVDGEAVSRLVLATVTDQLRGGTGGAALLFLLEELYRTDGPVRP